MAIRDNSLWSLVQEIHKAEVARFGRRYSDGVRELKGKQILKRKVFRHAQLGCELPENEIPALAKAILDDGASRDTERHLKALALAKIAYVEDVFSICEGYQSRAFASIVAKDAPQSRSDGLRKDYAYLFERFFYFLEDKKDTSGYPEQGILVFDELEKAKSHLLVDQAHRYFKETTTGRSRSSLVIPEPFFVQSDLTTGVQIADLVAYCVSWGFRLPSMHLPAREELKPYQEKLKRLRYCSRREKEGNPQFPVWSFTYIDDLRTRYGKIKKAVWGFYPNRASKLSLCKARAEVK